MDAGHLPTLAESVVSFAGGRVNSIPAKVGQFCAGADTPEDVASFLDDLLGLYTHQLGLGDGRGHRRSIHADRRQAAQPGCVVCGAPPAEGIQYPFPRLRIAQMLVGEVEREHGEVGADRVEAQAWCVAG